MSNEFKYTTCWEAAGQGDLEELKLMHQAGYPLFRQRTFYEQNNSALSAAVNGHLDCLRYAHENGCQWHISTTGYAASKGFIDCLKYAHQNGAQLNVFTTVGAAANGHLDCLSYAHKNGCVWDESTTWWAALNGHFDCLRYAHENGCDWGEKTPEKAAENRTFDCLRYAIENGCPYDHSNELINQFIVNLKSLKRLIEKISENHLNDNIVKHIIVKYV
jgi:hypothetical protein